MPTDADGNALGGVRHPLLAAPLATHVGWSLRTSGYGEGELFTIQGSILWGRRQRHRTVRRPGVAVMPNVLATQRMHH
ncbi:MAG: alpha/beta hydrolase domain-containing protein [Alphaproteobacteria bacterium]